MYLYRILELKVRISTQKHDPCTQCRPNRVKIQTKTENVGI